MTIEVMAVKVRVVLLFIKTITFIFILMSFSNLRFCIYRETFGVIDDSFLAISMDDFVGSRNPSQSPFNVRGVSPVSDSNRNQNISFVIGGRVMVMMNLKIVVMMMKDSKIHRKGKQPTLMMICLQLIYLMNSWI